MNKDSLSNKAIKNNMNQPKLSEFEKALEDYGRARLNLTEALKNEIDSQTHTRAMREAFLLARDNLRAVEREELGY